MYACSTIDLSNVWDGTIMEGRLEDYQTQFHTGKELGGHILGLLGDCRGLRVLDLGCGDGLLTQQILEGNTATDTDADPSTTDNAASAGVSVVGVDLDPAFVKAAQYAGLDARVGDGHDLTGFEDASFDRVFSNASIHWPANHK